MSINFKLFQLTLILFLLITAGSTNLKAQATPHSNASDSSLVPGNSTVILRDLRFIGESLREEHRVDTLLQKTRYEVRGRASWTYYSRAQDPLPNIRAVFYKTINDVLVPVDSMQTNKKGEFRFFADVYGLGDVYHLKLIDIDGEENHEFLTHEQNILLPIEPKGKGLKDLGNVLLTLKRRNKDIRIK